MCDVLIFYDINSSLILINRLVDIRGMSNDLFITVWALYRVIIVLGVNAGTQLPNTIATLHDQSNEASLPIACGKIVRIINE